MQGWIEHEFRLIFSKMSPEGCEIGSDNNNSMYNHVSEGRTNFRKSEEG